VGDAGAVDQAQFGRRIVPGVGGQAQPPTVQGAASKVAEIMIVPSIARSLALVN